MSEYRVLLVDDEPHVVEDVAMLLEDIRDYNIDLYRAYSAEEALRLLDEGRMDLVISDIEMQGMSGLSLLEEIHRRWPSCPVAFLTAHPNFSYAYHAIQNRAADYILKNEDDDRLVEKITGMLDLISQRDHLHSGQLRIDTARLHEDAPRLSRILYERDRDRLYSQMRKIGFVPNNASYCLLVCSMPHLENQVRSQAIVELLRYHIQKRFDKHHCMVNAQSEIIYMVQLSGENDLQDMRALFGLLEASQRCCEATFDRPLSIIMQPFNINSCLPIEAWKLAMDEHVRIQDTSKSILFARGLSDKPESPIALPADSENCDVVHYTVEWICRYIEENISGDVSLLKLSTLTGYNAQYLSGVFHLHTGQTLSRYVAIKRLDRVMQLLADRDIPIQKVARLAGFSSRSYFNRFVKQETSQTPQQLRAKLIPPAQSTNTTDSRYKKVE